MKLKKLTISAMLVAVAVILSSFSIPIGPSRCFPIQHLCNVLAAVFLGPVYGVSMAFCTALIRNLLGTGSLLAFPGSMVGAFVSAMIFKYTRSKIGAYLALVLGDKELLEKVEPLVEYIAAAADEGLTPDGSMIYETFLDKDRKSVV